MKKILIELIDVHAEIAGKKILQGFSLTIKENETHAIMGPNGAGKSTLANILAGHPDYEVTSGTILFEGKDLLELEPSERAHLGIFMSFQYPIEVPGVHNQEFLEKAVAEKRKAQNKPPLTKEEFSKLLHETMKRLDVDFSFKERGLNEGFSGGEKKKNEMLQLALLEPKLAILDETDSGLDVDAIKVTAKNINLCKNHCSLLLITHYARLLKLVEPDHVHVMVEGRIEESGGMDLCYEVDEKGYTAKTEVS